MKRLHVWISGRVQGVGFRHFTRQNARSLSVDGWVKNLADGRVEAVLQGEENKVSELVNRLHQGPRTAKVTDFEKQEESVDPNLNNFSVKY
jgi:acylphosphatase